MADEDCAFLYQGGDGKQHRQRYPLEECQSGWCRHIPKESMSKAQLDIASVPRCAKQSDCCRGRELTEEECAFSKECRDGTCAWPLNCTPQTCRGDLSMSQYSRAECVANKCTYPCTADADCTHFPNGELQFRHIDVCSKGQCIHPCSEENCDRADLARGFPRGMGCARAATPSSGD